MPDIENISSAYVDFFNNLRKPKAFFIRLLNEKHCRFREVERYFRQIVDPVIEEMGYERYEAGLDPISKGFMNVEIFHELHHSSLIIADLTGARPNCFVELGYALGIPKKTIILVNENTHLPWDVSSIQCHKWNFDEEDEERKRKLREFIRININKDPIIK